ncbi:hypothetical protein BO71DRAFT_482710 [Aspergillus ellipticus CBS 707.79]|uniref:Uncharacterized protein n=1 Tax=Aspergillus ellipticus CBS 707.79 TaxID=1448320 RepID=A0A319DE50_9EURO|nr:hypothetical protein BO71DRAFT_482710 [Aspergillus ellipticus CBS 707.79]
MATFLLDDYSRTASCPEWMDSVQWENEILPLSLSETEKRRFFRALYRLQTYGNIFGGIERVLDSDWSLEDNLWYEKDPTFCNEEAWRLFFGTMAPYQKLVDKIAQGLVDTSALFFSELPEDQRPPEAISLCDCHELQTREWQTREGLASTGPALLYKILHEDEPLAQRNLVLVNTKMQREHFHTDDLWPRPESVPWAMPLLYPADKFNFGTDRDGLRNLLESLPSFERPNLAWERKWLRDDGDFPEVFPDMFEYALGNRHWNWGYAMWDDERAAQWKAPMLDENYPGYDP